jgi:uncharacterized protein (TIGR00369 family)
VSAFTPSDPDFEARGRRSFARSTMLATLGMTIERIEAGAVDLAMPVAGHILQQHGFVHAGAVSTLADSACGFAALTLMPAGAGVLTVEFKMNLMAPAAGERILARGRVVKAGRTLVVTQADIVAETAGRERAVALMTATMMTIEGRDGIVD